MSTLPLSSRLAALALAAAATGAQAAELGDATVRSYLGQPLSADIELTDLSSQDLADLQARLARPDVFAGANVTMSPALAGANVSVVRRDGRRVLHVTTNAPVQGEVLHLYFDLVSAGKEKVRGVTLWLTPDPNPPARVAAAPAPAPVPLVATAAPGKDATGNERELLASMERAFASREPKKPAKPVLTAEMVRKEALKHASTADDFKRGAPKAAAEPKPEPKVVAHEPEEKEPKRKPGGKLQLASRAELAEAARATKASVAEVAKPAPAPVSAPAPVAAPKAPETDPAMLKKLAELEGKLKSLQKMVDERPAPVPVAAPAAPQKPAAHAVAQPAKAAPAPEVAAAPAPQPAKPASAPQVAETPAPVTPQSPPSKPITPAPQLASTDEEGAGEHVTASAQATSAAAMATVDEPKKEPPKEAKAPEPPPPEKKEMKISRPKILTFLFAGSIVLLLVFGVIVHFIRKAKNKRSPIVRQTWARDEDDAPRKEPTVQAEAPPAT